MTMRKTQNKHRLFLIIGKSATGKDHILKELLDGGLLLSPVVPYTTRPMREKESEGVEYHFLGIPEMEELDKAGRIVEKRTYQTVMGPWHYMTVDDGQIDLLRKSSILIATLESYEKLREFYGEENTIPIYIEVPDLLRLKRSIIREEKQDKPNASEICRRYLADEEDFSEERLDRLGIKKRFQNLTLDDCVNEIREYIISVLGDEK